MCISRSQSQEQLLAQRLQRRVQRVADKESGAPSLEATPSTAGVCAMADTSETGALSGPFGADIPPHLQVTLPASRRVGTPACRSASCCNVCLPQRLPVAAPAVATPACRTSCPPHRLPHRTACRTAAPARRSACPPQRWPGVGTLARRHAATPPRLFPCPRRWLPSPPLHATRLFGMHRPPPPPPITSPPVAAVPHR